MYKSLGILLLVGATLCLGQVPQKLRGDDEPLARRKRQIPVPTFPSFGPEVERTADGVPILDESYLERRDRPASRFFSQFEAPETEGLKLYEGLLGGSSSGGRPELRSLDGEHPFEDEFQNGLQSGSQSNSWTRKTHSRRTSRKEIKVKSAGSTATTRAADLQSGFGPSTGPQFSEEVQYQRSTNANKRSNSRLRSLDSNGGSNCVTCSRRIAVSSDEAPGAVELRTLTRSTTTKNNGHESEGLRLYRKLLRNGGSRNQLRSLDQSSDIPQNGIMPHHRQSAAWSRREEKHESHSQDSTVSSANHNGSPVSPVSQHQHSDEVDYRRTSAGRRSSSLNAGRTRSLSSSASDTASNTQSNGGRSCVQCRTRSSSTLVTDDSPATYHRSSRVPSTGDYLVPTPAASTAWAEREERRHHSSRTVSRTINGVETNGLGEPLVSEEEATYRRAASGGSHSGSASQVRSGTRTLSTADQLNGHSASRTHSTADQLNGHSDSRTHSTADQLNSHSAARTHSSSNSESSRTHQAARTLSVAGANTNGNGRSNRRYNCSRISTIGLSEGAQSITEIVTPPPCLVRSSSNDNQLRTGASTRSLPYPPVTTFGRGDQEVHARVLESDHESDSAFNLNRHHQQQLHSEENHEESSSSTHAQPTETSYRTGRKHKKAFYRRTVFKNYTTSEYPASIETWLGA